MKCIEDIPAIRPWTSARRVRMASVLALAFSSATRAAARRPRSSASGRDGLPSEESGDEAGRSRPAADTTPDSSRRRRTDLLSSSCHPVGWLSTQGSSSSHAAHLSILMKRPKNDHGMRNELQHIGVWKFSSIYIIFNLYTNDHGSPTSLTRTTLCTDEYTATEYIYSCNYTV